MYKLCFKLIFISEICISHWRCDDMVEACLFLWERYNNKCDHIIQLFAQNRN